MLRIMHGDTVIHLIDDDVCEETSCNKNETLDLIDEIVKVLEGHSERLARLEEDR